jgi:hypothetical protein
MSAPLRAVESWSIVEARDDRQATEIEHLECGHVIERRRGIYPTFADRRRCAACAIVMAYRTTTKEKQS